MKIFIAIASLLQLSFCSHVAIKLPYSNPAGVTYINNFQGQEHPISYGSAVYSQPQTTQYTGPAPSSYQYQSAAFNQQQNALRYSTPVQYQTGLSYATPSAAVYPAANVAAHHVGYAAAQVPAVAAVPFVKHVPTVSNVPVTRYEAHHGLIEQQVDIAKPAVSTRKFEVRRPAIQKQFYDIEERVIVRPAGSALVELDEPTSKIQRGPAVLSESSLLGVTASPLSHQYLSQATLISQSASSPNAIPVSSNTPLHGGQSISSTGVSHTPELSASSVDESSKIDEESVVVDNPNFRSSIFRDNSASVRGTLFRSSQQSNENQVASRGQENQYQDYLRNEYKQSSQLEEQSRQQYEQQYEQQQQQSNSRASGPSVITRSNATPLNTEALFPSRETSASVFPRIRTSPEQSRSNQQTLIDLLTAHGGITEVGFGRNGPASVIGDAENIRARVISATPSYDNAKPASERVSTRRVVVSKPVETLQEIDVAEPVTKYERTSVHQPTIFKTAHLDHVQVHSSVPVIGKALTPALAHVSVPVYQKTVTPAAYHYY